MSASATDIPLPPWNDTATRRAITRFVETVTRADGPGFVPPQERVAVFDNDGTLWCEKPMLIQADFILRRPAKQEGDDAALRERQPWKAAYEKDYTWLGTAIVRHYRWDTSDLKVLLGRVQGAFEGMCVEEYEAEAECFLLSRRHSALGHAYLAYGYRAMAELLRYLVGHGFAAYIALGGDRDFMRPTAWEPHGIPRERVAGSSYALHCQDDEHGGALLYKAGLASFDDGPEKPVRIWGCVGRRPILAAVNANGDVEMLRFAGGLRKPALRLLLLHDDAEHEFAYVAGAEHALEQAKAQVWTVVSVRPDWATVF